MKINGSNEEMLRAAAEQFGSKSTQEIIFVAKETLEGHQRAIMGNMTVEEIYRDRKQFSSRVFEVASTDLVNMGIMIISYTIKDITDEVGYLAVSRRGFISPLGAFSFSVSLVRQSVDLSCPFFCTNSSSE